MATTPATMTRTSYCGEVTADWTGQDVVLKGWVHNRRDHGGILFVDLRDREGLVQIVFDPEVLSAPAFDRASHFRYEDVLAIHGRVRPRPEGTINPNMRTGTVEVLVDTYDILNEAAPLPFLIDEHSKVNEDLRLKYRYLDVRRPELQQNLIKRAQLCRIMRRSLDNEGFIEFETPILTKSTPEGARDFLVPSRLNPGTFYALPQSPQLFKQLLMVGGMDRYYQIARCFRDEDLRANRQPEFTQLDIEMSFPNREMLFGVMERMMAAIFLEMKGIELTLPFDRLSYADAMMRFGSDKPDRRFGMEIQDLTQVMQSGGCEFKVFSELLESDGIIRALCVEGGGEKYSNTQLKPGGELPAHAARYGAKGLAWFRVEADANGTLALNSSISKFFDPALQSRLIKTMGAKAGDLLLLIADTPTVTATALGQLRLKIARELGMIPEGVYNFCWITDFPLFEWSAEDGRWYSVNHPFTAPHLEAWETLEEDPGKALALAYDLALNGEEIGGGSIRIHRPDLQMRVFKILGLSDEEAKEKFGFLMEAFQFGAPPHGGIAFGVDRVLMMLLGVDSIRDVIAFPKTQTGTCVMTQAPSNVDDAQLRELHLRSTAIKQ